MLSHRFERGGRICDIDIAIQVLADTMNQLVSAGGSHGERHAAVFQRLGHALLLRSEQTGSAQDMDHGMSLIQSSLNLFSADSVEHALCRILIGRGSHIKFEQTGALNLLNEAIGSLDGAVKRLPLEHQGRAAAASNLGVMLYRRFERLASLDDLDEAIVAYVAAIDSTPRNDFTYPDLLNNYACFLSSRYVRTGKRQDIEGAIRTSENIVEFVGGMHENGGKYLNSLARHFHARYERQNTPDDLDRAISASEKSLGRVLSHHPDRERILYDLGVAFGQRYVHSQAMEDLDRGIENVEASLQCASSLGPSRANALSSLGDMLRLRMEHPTDRQLTHDLAQVISAYQSALDIESARPLVRIQSARRSAELTKDIKLACMSLIRAVHLMPYLCPRSLHRNDQQYVLATVSRLASQAVAYILGHEHEHKHTAFEALKTLEIARGASLLIDVRTDLNDLSISNPHLADDFQRLREVLDSPKMPLSTDLRSELDSSRRQKAATDFEDVLRQIRKIPGFKSFLDGPTEEELKILTVHGPLVIFNVASMRSDALLVTSDGVRSLHLPSLNAVELEAHAKSVLAALDGLTPRTYAKVNKTLRHVLEWLWDVAVGPILDALGFTETPKEGEDWPHVWWVACGWLNMLPIHAAGYHNEESSRNALDRVISSYTITIKARTYSQISATSQSSQSPAALLVCMPETPDLTPLRHARAEVDDLDRILPPSIARTIMESPSKAHVLSAVRTCDILHFACHGKFDPDNPSHSHLLLQDWANDLLSTADITSLKLDRPRLVYLSACHGASNRTESLFDEGIHIAGAFQLAGFQHVIGTLWQIGQHFSLNVSRDVYSAITADARFDVEKAAEGLHGALRSLRSLVVQEYGVSRRMCNEPLIWAPYIHMGG
jgi:tetratricopeptide (TPR) repeat protein